MTAHICSLEDCYSPAVTRGLCKAHYRRWQRHGTPLGGNTSPGETARFAREVVMTYEGNDCFIWPYGTDGSGRGSIMIDRKHIRASRYVCLMAHGEPPVPGMHAAHSCGNGHLGCVNKKHLRWATAVENAMDREKHGTARKGVEIATAKLTEQQVLEIASTPADQVSNRAFARKYGLHPETVRAIRTGKSWGWLVNPRTTGGNNAAA